MRAIVARCNSFHSMYHLNLVIERISFVKLIQASDESSSVWTLCARAYGAPAIRDSYLSSFL
jgi:hypothetical protein